MKPLDTTHILSKLVQAKRERLQKAKMRVPEAVVKQMAKAAPAVASFKSALESPAAVRVIAEIKKASPSKGILAKDLRVAELAGIYKTSGAAAISAVTDRKSTRLNSSHIP